MKQFPVFFIGFSFTGFIIIYYKPEFKLKKFPFDIFLSRIHQKVFFLWAFYQIKNKYGHGEFQCGR